MSKIKLYIDFDDTLADSNKALRMLYADVFKTHVPPELLEWDGRDQFKLAPEGWVKNVFKEDEIWKYIRLFKDCEPILQKLKDSDLFDMQICSIGYPNNIKNKIDFLERYNMGRYFSEYHLITKATDKFEMGKDIIQDGILIDDNIKNFGKVKRPILFTIGEEKLWNSGWEGSRIKGWNEESLNTIMKVAINEINSKSFQK